MSPTIRPGARGSPKDISALEYIGIFLCCLLPGIAIGAVTIMILYIVLISVDHRLDLVRFRERYPTADLILNVLVYFTSTFWVFHKWCRRVQARHVLRLGQEEELERVTNSRSLNRPSSSIGRNMSSQPIPSVSTAPDRAETVVPAPPPRPRPTQTAMSSADAAAREARGSPKDISALEYIGIFLCCLLPGFAIGEVTLMILSMILISVDHRLDLARFSDRYPATYLIFVFLIYFRISLCVSRKWYRRIQARRVLRLGKEDELERARILIGPNRHSQQIPSISLASGQTNTTVPAPSPPQTKSPTPKAASPTDAAPGRPRVRGGSKVIAAFGRLLIFLCSLLLGLILTMITLGILWQTVSQWNIIWFVYWNGGAFIVLLFLFYAATTFWVFRWLCSWLQEGRLDRLEKEEQLRDSRATNRPMPHVTLNQPIGSSTEASIHQTAPPLPPFPSAPIGTTRSTTILDVPGTPQPLPLVTSTAPIPAPTTPSMPAPTSVVPPPPPPPPQPQSQARPPTPPLPLPPPPPATSAPPGTTAPQPGVPAPPPAEEEPLDIAELPAYPVDEVSGRRQWATFEFSSRSPEQDHAPELTCSHNDTPKETESVVLLPCDHLCEVPWDGIGSFTCQMCGEAVWEFVGQAKD